MIENGVTWSEINKGPSIKTQGASPNETDWLLLSSAELIDFNQELSVNSLSEDNNIEVADEISCNFTLEVIDFNIWVKFLKLANGGSSSGCLSNIFFSGVEVGSEVWSGDCFCIMDSDRLWSSKNQVFSGFETNLWQNQNPILNFSEISPNKTRIKQPKKILNSPNK